MHHKAGRSGVLLWHQELFAVLCDKCHLQEVHGNPSRSRSEGWIVDLSRSEYNRIEQEERPKLWD